MGRGSNSPTSAQVATLRSVASDTLDSVAGEVAVCLRGLGDNSITVNSNRRLAGRLRLVLDREHSPEELLEILDEAQRPLLASGRARHSALLTRMRAQMASPTPVVAA